MNLQAADVAMKVPSVKIASIWYVIFAKNESKMPTETTSTHKFAKIVLHILDAKHVVMMLQSAIFLSRTIFKHAVKRIVPRGSFRR